MRARKYQTLSRKYLLPHLPGFAANECLVFSYPYDYLLRGFCYEGSWNPSGFYLNTFVQPLFIPCSYIYFLIGRRLGIPDLWIISDVDEVNVMRRVFDCVRNEGLPLLERYQAPSDLAKVLDGQDIASHDPYMVEAVAYAFALEGTKDAAADMLSRLDTVIASARPGPPWLDVIAQRAQQVRLAMAAGPGNAKSLLDEWRGQTLRALRLPEATR